MSIRIWRDDGLRVVAKSAFQNSRRPGLQPRQSAGRPTTVAPASRGVPPGTIAFRRYLDTEQTHAAIFSMSTDGTGARKLTDPPVNVIDSSPSWSPDGARIAFQREFTNKPYEVYIINADGSGLTQVDPGCPEGIPQSQICEETDPAWSPDGSRLAFGWPYGTLRKVKGEDTIEVASIGLMDPNGGNVVQITQLVRPSTSEDSTPAWSPDGKRIAFIRVIITAEPPDGAALFVVDADGANEKQLTPWELRAADPDWSPDGREISFRSEPHASMEFVGSLYTVRPDGTELHQLTPDDSKVHVLGSSFSADSEWIVFARTGVGGLPDLFIMRRDGTELVPLTETPVWDSAPDWAP